MCLKPGIRSCINLNLCILTYTSTFLVGQKLGEFEGKNFCPQVLKAPPLRPNTCRAEPSRNFPFLFRIFLGGARKRKIVREISARLPPKRSGGGRRGGRRAYDLGQSHHALRAWHIVSDFGNRCELGKIKTPQKTTQPSGLGGFLWWRWRELNPRVENKIKKNLQS